MRMGKLLIALMVVVAAGFGGRASADSLLNLTFGSPDIPGTGQVDYNATTDVFTLSGMSLAGNIVTLNATINASGHATAGTLDVTGAGGVGPFFHSTSLYGFRARGYPDYRI